MNSPFLSLDATRQTLAIISQVYVPDPAAVGQYMHDAAKEMVRRDWQVVVFTSDRGYEDPTKRYPAREILEGVRVVRLPFSSFGKSGIAARLAGGAVFLSEATLFALRLPRIDRALVTTSPPMGGLAGVALRRARHVPFTFWAMDINPDQIVAMGTLGQESLPVRGFDWINHQVLSNADQVVALDRFMARRLEGKTPLRDKLSILAPWPFTDATDPVLAYSDNPFRAKLAVGDKRVVMYSGNLSPVHPVKTILDAARLLKDDDRLVFLFVGGGSGRAEIDRYVREYGLQNVQTLPYQPFSEIRYSLAAADVHLVAMGSNMVGIVHPSKIYGALSAGRPVLALGPRESHIAEIVVDNRIGWHVEHGNVNGAAHALREIATAPAETLFEMGQRARRTVDEQFARRALLGRFCDLLEQRSA